MLCVCHIGKTAFAIGSFHFQSVTICNAFIAFILQAFFQDTPIRLRIRAFRQDTHDIYDRKIPFLCRFVPCCSNRLILKELQILVHRMIAPHQNTFCLLQVDAHKVCGVLFPVDMDAIIHPSPHVIAGRAAVASFSTWPMGLRITKWARESACVSVWLMRTR